MTLQWTLLIPLKALPAAKSRLAVSLPAHQHVDLVQAIRADTVAAAVAAGGVARVVVVVDQVDEFTDLELITIIQTRPGLNPGLEEAAAQAAARRPDDGVAALVADLPALRAEDLAAALEAATHHPRSFVPDVSGLGTTLLAARPGVSLSPAYGIGSAARHGAIAVALSAAPGLRADVDTAEDLDHCRVIGVGPRTRAVLDSFVEQN